MVPPVKRRGPKAQANEPVIDAEFQSRIPPLTPEEDALLRESLISEGCRETIKTWGGKIIDGHHRHRWCSDPELNIKYKTEEIKGLPDREAVLDWIDRNQLGQRNLSDDVKALIRGRILNREKNKIGRPKAEEKMSHSETIKKPKKSRTSKKLADKFGVSRATVDRDGAYAAAVEALKPIVPDLEAQVIRGKGPPRKLVVEAAQAAQKNPKKAKEILTRKPEKKSKDKPPASPATSTTSSPTPPTPSAASSPPTLALMCPHHGVIPQESITTQKTCGLCMEEMQCDAGSAPRLILAPPSPDTPPTPPEPTPTQYPGSALERIKLYREAAEKVLDGIDSSPTTPEGPWNGKVWLRVPNGLDIKATEALVVKLSDQRVERSGEATEAIALVPANTGTEWWQFITKISKTICFPKLSDLTICYIGDNEEAFMREFINFGMIFVTVRPNPLEGIAAP